ncbi:MAG: vanadium-dependent haloperoxidase [Deltaproteobacteria bacterium]
MRFLLAVLLCFSGALPVRAGPAEDVIGQWYRLTLELVRHTPTYSPPVAARAYAYFGVIAWEVAASDDADLTSLAGQLAGLDALPARPEGLDQTVVLEAALSLAAHELFANTGPMGQRAMGAMSAQLDGEAATDLSPQLIADSTAYGQAVARHVLDWSASDGGLVVENMGFPMAWNISSEPGHWVPTSTVIQQQAPLLPDWGNNRPLAMPAGTECGLPPPPAYSEEPSSEFYKQAVEVFEAVKNLSPEQEAIARFWSDDPMLSPTPPGHWISITLDILDDQDADFVTRADVLARLGIAVNDAFIGCWHSKFEYDLIRPVAYIKALIEPNFEPILITPPFPEYPSGHSVQSGAAAMVLTALFGPDFAFDDATHEDDGLDVRHFTSFYAAADEAAISRLYGGIHFRAAIDNGLLQGKCIGAYAAGLKTR